MSEQTSSNNCSTIHITYAGDLFEVGFRGCVISRITCYEGGSHKRDCQYDDLPARVQDSILSEVERILNR